MSLVLAGSIPAFYNPLTIPTMETLLYISIGLFAIACIAVGYTVRKHNKMFAENEDPVLIEDAPARYEEFEEAFYNP